MRIHCDACGAALEAGTAVVREWDGERFYFCDAKCAAKGGHLADEPAPDPDEHGAGPVAAGDLDDEGEG